jgi:hypothetical protein
MGQSDSSSLIAIGLDRRIQQRERVAQNWWLMRDEAISEEPQAEIQPVNFGYALREWHPRNFGEPHALEWN